MNTLLLKKDIAPAAHRVDARWAVLCLFEEKGKSIKWDVSVCSTEAY